MSFWYLATPYSKYPQNKGGLAGAHKRACELAAMLLKNGFHVYCPIAHTHPIAIAGNVDPLDHSLWMALDMPFMISAKGLIVAQMEGWSHSKGVQAEMECFKKWGKPIRFLPDTTEFQGLYDE